MKISSPSRKTSTRKPSHLGSKIQPSPSGSSATRLASIGKSGGLTGSCTPSASLGGSGRGGRRCGRGRRRGRRRGGPAAARARHRERDGAGADLHGPDRLAVACAVAKLLVPSAPALEGACGERGGLGRGLRARAGAV